MTTTMMNQMSSLSTDKSSDCEFGSCLSNDIGEDAVKALGINERPMTLTLKTMCNNFIE